MFCQAHCSFSHLAAAPAARRINTLHGERQAQHKAFQYHQSTTMLRAALPGVTTTITRRRSCYSGAASPRVKARQRTWHGASAGIQQQRRHR